DRREFHPGEIIPLELEFASGVPRRFAVDGRTSDRSGQLTIDDFTLTPADGAADPMRDYFGSIDGFIGGGLGTTSLLGAGTVIVPLDLNDWLRFARPGPFRLSVRSRRVTDTASRAVVPVASNSVSFTIVPRDAAWETTPLTEARRLLDARPPPP